jgi:serine/threonine protein kinase
VAIKVVREGEVGQGAFDDLIREAGLLRGLKHANVVEYREFADRPDIGCAFLVTELVEGGDLSRHLRRSGAYTAADAARLGLQLVAALQALHARGVLHRDLKPSNVLVCVQSEGLPTLRVADFGISRRIRGGVVETLDVKLTPAFAAPEQFRQGTLTPAADVYALGALLYTLMTGEAPQEDLSRLSELDLPSPQMADLVQGLVRADPAARLGLTEVAAGLEAIAEGRSPAALAQPKVQVSAATTESAPPSAVSLRSRAGTVRVAIGVAVLGALGIWAALPSHEMGESAQAPAPLPPAVVPSPVEPPPPLHAQPQAEAQAVPPTEPRAEAEPAVLQISTQPWSHVRVDGKRVGRTKIGGARFTLAPGRHKVVLEAEDGTRYKKTVRLKSGQTERLCVKLRAGLETACR